MASSGGRNRTPVSQRLYSEAFRFDFFQAVRLLEWTSREQAVAAPSRQRFPVGEDHPPGQEIVRFRAIPSLSFPSASISKVSPPRDGGEDPGPPEMTVAAIGLTGPNGVLPPHYTALVIDRIGHKDYNLRDFLDLFNHRVASLFYRAWEKYHFPFAYERAHLVPDAPDDLFTFCLYSLLGMGTEGLRGRMEFDDEALLYYIGHFAHRPRCAISLEQVLADYFEVATEVQQFRGVWLALDPDDLSLLPSARLPRGRNNGLGVDLLVGERVWNVENRFRIRLGPLGYRQFCRFMPSGDALKPLVQMTRFYVGPQYDFDVQLVLMAREVPWCRLGNTADPAYLGWNIWVRAREFGNDVDDPVFTLET